MAKGNSWYNSMSWIVKLILAIIPVTSWLVHAFARITSGKVSGIVVGLICLLTGALAGVFWFVDLITVIVSHKLICA